MLKKELTPLQENKHQEVSNLAYNGTGGRSEKCIKVRAIEHRDFVSVFQEEGACGGKGALSNILRFAKLKHIKRPEELTMDELKDGLQFC